jgi:hypothetical protein
VRKLTDSLIADDGKKLQVLLEQTPELLIFVF